MCSDDKVTQCSKCGETEISCDCCNHVRPRMLCLDCGGHYCNERCLKSGEGIQKVRIVGWKNDKQRAKK